MRDWLLTSTTYGTWLPGDRRRSVSDIDGETSIIEPRPRLAAYAKQVQKTERVLLTADQARIVCKQFQETAKHRGWSLLAVAIMANHFHVVMQVTGDPDPNKMLNDLKAYASRSSNKAFGRRDRWWTRGGSRRKLPNECAVLAAIHYVMHKQPSPLVNWAPDD